jgi:hypothetical protein
MADCEKLKTCPFFADQMASLPLSSDAMKQSYCRGDKTACARYLVAAEGIPVPRDLFPNERYRVLQLLSGGRNRTIDW